MNIDLILQLEQYVPKSSWLSLTYLLAYIIPTGRLKGQCINLDVR